MLIDANKLQACVHTTWWNRDEEKFAFYRGWPSGKEDSFQELQQLWEMQARKKKKPCVSVSLHTALTNRSTCSSYLVQYAPTLLNVRLRTQAMNPGPYSVVQDVDADGIRMILAIFDLDCHENDNVDQWFDDQRQKLDGLLDDHPGLFIYRSRGGMRILGVLPEPMPMRSHEDADAWTRRYGAWCNYLARKYNLKTEGKDTVDKLADWTRFQRVPHDCRVKGDEPNILETIGDPEWVGTWEPQLIGEDWPVMSSTSHEHLNYSGDCQLLNLVRMKGLTCDTTNSPEVYDILCPDAGCHSESAYRKTKTLLYANGPIGKIECKSTGCQSKHPDKNVSYFECFPKDMVIRTSTNWMYDPVVLKIQDRIDRRQHRIDWDTPENDPIFAHLAADERLLKVAKEQACIPRTVNEKAFCLWCLKQKPNRKPQDPEAKLAYLLTLDA
jgi:hypothetical protein